MIEKQNKRIKGYLSDISLIKVIPLRNGMKLRIENDDWGKFLRVIDKENYTIHSKVVVDEENIVKYIDELKEAFG